MEKQDVHKRPSFLIADILSEKPLAKKNDLLLHKFPSLVYPVFHPATLAAFSSFLYSDPYNFQCHSVDGSVPVPLPVYVRTKSTGGDAFTQPKKCRRSRTVFTELQLMGLEKKFESHKYLSTPDRSDLAECLGLSQIQVKTWYQNRRMKWKKQVLQRGGTQAPTKPKGRPKKVTEETIQKCYEHCDSEQDASDL